MFLQGPVKSINPIIFDSITPELIRMIAIKTKGAAGPSQLNADEWRRILATKTYGTEGVDLCKSIARLTKMLCVEDIDDPDSISALMACRLIPLNKCPGLRPIGIGEILRRIVSKAVTWVLKSSLQDAAGGLQLCVGLEGGAEDAIHAMNEIFEDDQTHGLIQVDANNAFNTINRKVLLHNIGILCPEISIYFTNCYKQPAKLFVMGGVQIQSSEGTTQGDPIAMPMYAIGIIPLMRVAKAKVQSTSCSIKQVAFADDLTGAGDIHSLKVWWDTINEDGFFMGYFAKPTKSWLIVKPEYVLHAQQIFKDSCIQITTEGNRHLGAVVGSNKHKDKFVNSKVAEWVNEIILLGKIAQTEPHVAYAAFTHGLRHKYTYIMRTIPNISQHLKPLDKAIDEHLIKTLFRNHNINEFERSLFSLPVKMGGLGIIIHSEMSDIQYKNSTYIYSSLTTSIINQEELLILNQEDLKKRKSEITSSRTKQN